MIHRIRLIISSIIKKINRIGYKHLDPSATIQRGVKVYNKDNLIMGLRANINQGAIIMNTRAKFIMKDHSGAALGLLVITGNHMNVLGKFIKDMSDEDKGEFSNPKEYDKDIIVEEDVWLGAHTTLLFGALIKRGAIVGAGSVVRTIVPPYSIVVGNPAKVIGFRFSPDEIIEHEKRLYSAEERLSREELEYNYNKYYLKRINYISQFIKI